MKNNRGVTMANPLVSIVMPVYNVEAYIQESLESLIGQTYKNLEIICVDDGSTDSSLDIIKQFKERDERIQYITQNNQYAGIARNNGMKIAKGKYIMFLDSDDVFERNMVSSLVKIAEKKKTDIVFFGFTHFSSDLKKRSLMGIPYHSKKVHSPKELKDVLFRIAQGVPWNKFYNFEFVKSTGLQFQNLKSNNDVFFSKMIVPEAQRILFLNKRFVNYRISNSGSLQGSYKLTSGNFAKCILAIYEELLKRNKYELYKSTFENYVVDTFLLIFERIPERSTFYTVCDIIRESFQQMNMNEETPAIKNSVAQLVFLNIINNHFDDAMFELSNYKRNTYASKSSIEYRIGKKLLSLAKIKNYD